MLEHSDVDMILINLSSRSTRLLPYKLISPNKMTENTNKILPSASESVLNSVIYTCLANASCIALMELLHHHCSAYQPRSGCKIYASVIASESLVQKCNSNNPDSKNNFRR